MRIDEKSSLAPYTHIIDDYGRRRAFRWIDPIKRIGIELVSLDSIHTLEWKEDQPFPYNIMIRDPVTQEEYNNPCIHDLERLNKKAKSLKQKAINVIDKLYR
jgi:hypothetical protein